MSTRWILAFISSISAIFALNKMMTVDVAFFAGIAFSFFIYSIMIGIDEIIKLMKYNRSTTPVDN